MNQIREFVLKVKINEVNKKIGREKGDISIVIVIVEIEIRLAG
jgi:hypothetical protein